MSAPVILYPRASETGFRLKGVLQATNVLFTDAVRMRWQVSATNSFPAALPNLLYDTLMRDPDDVDHALTWVDIYSERFGEFTRYPPGAVASETVYVSCQAMDSVDTLSDWAAGVAITFEAARCSRVVWQAGQ